MMRIGVDIRGLLTGKISGVEQYGIQTLKHMLEVDTTNTYVLFYNSYRDLDEKFEKLIQDYPFFKNHNVEVKKMKWIDFPLLIHAFYKPLDWPKADIVCGGLDVMFMPSPQLLPLSRRCAKVTTFHDLIFMIYPQFYTRSSRLWQWQMNYPYEARTSDTVIAVSKSTKDDLVRLLGADPNKISVIHEGVGREYFVSPSSNDLDTARQKFGLPDKFIYYVGSIEPRKNLATVVRALHQLSSDHSDTIKLVISGSKNWLSSDLYKLVEELRLQDKVIFTGPVSEQEKITLLNLATVFVFPSLYEGFGLMVLEAFAAGCPVITSNVSSLPEVAGDAAILINPQNVSELIHQLNRLLEDDNLRQQLIDKGRERAKGFTWERSARETLRIIEETARKHGG